MSDIEDLRSEASACRRFGVAKLDWCDLPATLKTHAGNPQGLASIRADAELLLKAGARLERYAAVMVEREREKA